MSNPPPPRTILLDAFAAAVRAVAPETALPPHLPAPATGRTLILAIGKAAAAMAAAARPHMGPKAEVLVLTRYGHGLDGGALEGARVFEAGHPVPDAAGEAAAAAILDAVDGLGPDDLLLALMSGGGSALLAAPAPGVSLADLQDLTRAMLQSGAPIAAMNGVRKHVSRAQGGRLALRAAPARVVTLAISDIPGDDPGLVASGPTLPDPTTLADARAALDRYRIAAPASVLAALADPANETPKADDLPAPACTVIASAGHALAAAARVCAAAGFEPILLGDAIEGAADAVAREQAAVAREAAAAGRRCALISGGETTVTVRNPHGRGGRNTEYLLALALALDGLGGAYALAGDSDGIDGTEANAGAILGPDSLARARAVGLDPAAMLEANLSQPLFDALGDLVVTGPTRTNVNDVRVILVGA